MTKRPLAFIFFSLACLVLVVSFPVQVMMNYQMPLSEFKIALEFLTQMNYLVMLSLSLQAVATWRGSRWLAALSPITLCLVVYNNYQVGSWGYDYDLTQTHLASALFFGFSLYPLLPPFFRAIKTPSTRWWLVSERKAIEVPIRVSPVTGHRFHSYTVDISETGAFIESQNDDLRIGDEIDLSFSANSIRPLQLKAMVVRKGSNQRKRHHEFGYGVRFENIDSQQKKILENFLSTH